MVDSRTNFKAKIFKALSDPARLQILDYLRNCEKCECEIVPYLGLKQPAVSRHLKILTHQGILNFRKEGVRKMYSISTPKILEILDLIDDRHLLELKEAAIRRLEA